MSKPKLISQVKRTDCFSACVATLLDLELKDVPIFRKDGWYKDSRKWLNSIGWDALFQDVDGTWDEWSKWLNEDHYLIGHEYWQSEDQHHAFVLKGGKRFFDPAADRNDGKGKIIGIYFLMPLRPFIKE